jgi:hypothetical protein
MRGRDQVGELRPSQLLHTYGVGATVELPELTTLVLGLDEWPRLLGEPIAEPRLLAAVQSYLPTVEQLLTPPVVPDGENAGVPIAPFPRWLRCQRCSLLAPIDHGVFTLSRDLWRPERTSYVHEGCPKRFKRPPSAFPARYVMACQNGHLDDFPWVEFLHGNVECRGTLRLRELGKGGSPGDMQASCDKCHRTRRMSWAFGEKSRPFLPPRCRGRHAHLGSLEGCDARPETVVLGASNAWFPVSVSALSIPSQTGELARVVDDAWGVLGAFPPMPLELLDPILTTNPDLKELRELADKLGLEVVHEAIGARRDGLGQGDPEDLRTPEWRVLIDPEHAPETPDFKLRCVAVPSEYASHLADVVLVERLREVNALRGFTRLNSPADIGFRGGRIVRLSRDEPRWLPCTEVRGEGIFIRFPEERLRAWEETYRASSSVKDLRLGHEGWRTRRDLPPSEGWMGARYVLLHSFAHALLRELALECGYTASSIRERIYATGESGDDMAGVLLYTAAPDSEGTLGGLVSLGETAQFGPLLRQALERAQLCSSDPLCAEHNPAMDASVHLAACHACQFASETSCEHGNRWLDRTTLTPTLARGDLAYFPAT